MHELTSAKQYAGFYGKPYDSEYAARWRLSSHASDPNFRSVSMTTAPVAVQDTTLTSGSHLAPVSYPEFTTALTYEKLANVLNCAHAIVREQYLGYPILADALAHNIECAFEDCGAMHRAPQEIVDGFVENERLIVKAWNEHRLGNATLEKLSEANPATAAMIYNEYDNVEDVGTSFPLRCSSAMFLVAFKDPLPLPKIENPLKAMEYRGRVSQWNALQPTHVRPFSVVPFVGDSLTAISLKMTPSSVLGTSDPATMEPRTQTNRSQHTVNEKKSNVPIVPVAVTGGTAPTKRQPGRGVSGSANTPKKHNRLAGAPSQNLPFPQGPCNITVIEIVCFLPQWLKSIDVIDRIISNGGSAGAIAKMIGLLRDTGDESISSCSVLRMMQKPMKSRGGQYKHWAVGTHIPPPGHDPSSISVTGFRTPAQTHKGPSKAQTSVPFKDLAKNLKSLPQITDALDLTRCVQYHMHPTHQHEIWNFPDHFNALVQHLGGPIPITADSLDVAIFNRFMPPHTRRATQSMFARKRDAHGRLMKETQDSEENSEFDTQVSGSENSY